MGKNKPHEQLDRRGLPRAVRPEKSEHFTGLDLHGQVFQRALPFQVQKPVRVLLRKILDFYGWSEHIPIVREPAHIVNAVPSSLFAQKKKGVASPKD